MPRRGVIFLLLAAMFGLPQSARAHALGLEVSIRGAHVHIEAFFDDDTAAASAKVEVFDLKQKPLVSGKTDARGLWSFPKPAPGKYRVIVDAGAGHVERRLFTVPGTPSAVAAGADTSAQPQAANGSTISEGDTREESTRSRWLELGLGLGVIFTAAFLIARAMKAKKPPLEA